MVKKATPKSSIALDLDALAPAKVQINYKDKLVEVTPPTLEQYALVMDFADQMNKIEDKTENYKQITDLYGKIKDFIYECVPGLKDEPLNVAQITSLFELLSTLGAPSDRAVEELEAKGITVKSGGNSDPKASASPKP
jgi:hypothetical protein